ncbi:unnamed protein product, partial [Meganyctiphanes norvegica]
MATSAYHNSINFYYAFLILYSCFYIIRANVQNVNTFCKAVQLIQGDLLNDRRFKNLWYVKNTNRKQRKYGLRLSHIEDFFEELSRPQIRCKKLMQLGGIHCKGHTHGAQNLCMDSSLDITPKNCTVYSFGLVEYTPFEDMMSDYGCEVYMFDPTIKYENVKDSLKDNQYFYSYGLDIQNTVSMLDLEYENGTHELIKRTLLPYDLLRKKIDHEERVVHYLKIDIEGSEWKILDYLLENSLLEDILQIAIEVHATPLIHILRDGRNNEEQNPTHSNCSILHDDELATSSWVLDHIQEYWKILSKLQLHGFQRAYYKEHLNHIRENITDHEKTVSTCGDLLYIRTGRGFASKYE